MYGLKDPLQAINKTTCGIYVIYYGYNLFNPHESFNFLDEKGDLNTVKKLIDNIFVDVNNTNNSVDKNINFSILKQFKEAYNIKANLKDQSLLKAATQTPGKKQKHK